MQSVSSRNLWVILGLGFLTQLSFANTPGLQSRDIKLITSTMKELGCENLIDNDFMKFAESQAKDSCIVWSYDGEVNSHVKEKLVPVILKKLSGFSSSDLDSILKSTHLKCLASIENIELEILQKSIDERSADYGLRPAGYFWRHLSDLLTERHREATAVTGEWERKLKAIFTK